ncbi:MAG: acyl carrier protein [Phycisphaerae bacterium]|nr:acyl carrier protein [Phycisphaerae bacterium]
MIDLEAARNEILEWVSDAIRVPVEEIELDKPLAEVGIDSLDAVHMISTIESIIQQELPEDVMQRVKTLNDIFEMMRRRVAAA